MTRIASTLGIYLLLPYLGTVHPLGIPLEVPPCIRTGMRRTEWPLISTATTNLGGIRTTTPTTISRPSWFIRTTRSRNGRPLPLRHHLQDRPHIPFPSGSESTRSFTRKSRRRARNTAPESMLRMPFCCWASKGMHSFTPALSMTLYRSTQEANRPYTRSWVSTPSSSKTTLPLVCYTNPQNCVELSFLPATQHTLPSFPERTTFPCKPTPTPSRNPLRTSRSVSCVLFYVLPLPLFLHQVKYVQTSTQMHRNSVFFPILTFRSLAERARNPFFAL